MLLAAPVLTLGLFWTQSRGAILSVVVGLAVLLLVNPGRERMRFLVLMVPVAAVAVGAFALLALATGLVARGLRIAILARDDFGSLMAVDLTTSLGLHTLIIVAGNAKLIPLTGITFPFVSYGGSSLLASFLVLGLLLSISHRSAVDEGRTG